MPIGPSKGPREGNDQPGSGREMAERKALASGAYEICISTTGVVSPLAKITKTEANALIAVPLHTGNVDSLVDARAILLKLAVQPRSARFVLVRDLKEGDPEHASLTPAGLALSADSIGGASAEDLYGDTTVQELATALRNLKDLKVKAGSTGSSTLAIQHGHTVGGDTRANLANGGYTDLE